VFVNVSDPIGSGFIANLARPGGNITGVMHYEAGIVGKWLGLLKEIVPSLTRVAILANPERAPYDYFFRAAQALAPSLAIELVPSPVEDAAGIERSIQSLSREPNGGLVIPPDATTVVHRDFVIALAARHHLPTVYTANFWVESGGLMSYGTDQVDMFRQAAGYVDRILHGDKPADLPVQAPTKYETAINLKTARALGLTVPPGLTHRPLRPTLEDENGKPLADLGLLAKPTRLAIVPWLLVFFIDGASSSRCSAARRSWRANIR
jgi:putative ABC transport system substrate-binding protein